MKILISGATGFVGTELVKKLINFHEIIALVRTKSSTLPVEVKQLISKNIFDINLNNFIIIIYCV